MPEQVIIDGNNLWHALRELGPPGAVGRETLVKLVDRWANQADAQITIVFDGPTPREGLARQMATRRVRVRFSAPQSADDVIAGLLKNVGDPAVARLISSDTALRREADRRKCRHTDSVGFVSELYPPHKDRIPTSGSATFPRASPGTEKPEHVTPAEIDDWLRWLSANDLEIPGDWNELGR